jgi:putative ABC transport system permease protein
MHAMVSEIRLAVRVLARSRAYTMVAVLTLAVSMGATTAIFSMADAVLNRPFPFPRLDRVAALTTTLPKVGNTRYLVSPADFFDWLERSRAFASMAAYRGWDVQMTGTREPQPVRAFVVSRQFFAVFGAAPSMGRIFAGESEPHSIVVSYGFWHDRLKGEPRAVGSAIELNGQAYNIAGVMPREFDYPTDTDVWAPWIVTATPERTERADGSMAVLARLVDGVSIAQARAEMSVIAAGLARQHPETNSGRDAVVTAFTESLDPYARGYVSVVAAAVAFLLVLACANVANLQLLRATTRRRELALRAALGAARARIARQLLTEGVVLSMAGAALGLPLARMMLTAIRSGIPELVMRHLPGMMHAELDSRMLLWTFAASAISGAAFTLPAVLQACGKTTMVDGLKEDGRGAVGSGGRRLRSALVMGEMALAMVLLTCAVAILRTVNGLDPTKEGFNPANVYTFALRAPQDRYPGDAAVTNLYREVLRRLGESPQIGRAAAISELPALADTRTVSIAIGNQPAPPPDRPILAELRVASPEYFRTLGIALKSGRIFDAHDDGAREPVALVSESAAQRFWPHREAIGQRVRIVSNGAAPKWLRVVGTVADVNQFYLDAEIRPTVFVPCLQYPVRAMDILVEPAGSTERATAAVLAAVRAVDRGQAVFGLESLSRKFDEMGGGMGVIATLIGIFALLSLILSATGIYAVMHFSVTERTAEIGIRMALGALPDQVGRMVLKDTLRVTCVGVGIALPLTWAAGRMLTTLLAGIVGQGALAMMAAALLVVATALATTYLPARRAARIDPLTAIRHA